MSNVDAYNSIVSTSRNVVRMEDFSYFKNVDTRYDNGDNKLDAESIIADLCKSISYLQKKLIDITVEISTLKQHHQEDQKRFTAQENNLRVLREKFNMLSNSIE